MITREDALARILAKAGPTPTDTVPLADARGLVTAGPVAARLCLPPARVSAMDGYAVRGNDVGRAGARLVVIGEAPAGVPFDGLVGAGEAVRIFTGGVVPEGADHIVIQEQVDRDGDVAVVIADQPSPRHIRDRGLDFAAGDVVVPAGTRLGPAQLAVAAAANHGSVRVHGRPRVAVLANGDELRMPGGSDLAAGEVVCSTPFGLLALIDQWGGQGVDLGLARDDVGDIRGRLRRAVDDGVDVIVPVGGASVGDHDYMRAAFADEGVEIDFAKVAVRPGKPTWFGALGETLVLGLPGNPASALVCAYLFLRPLISALSGQMADPLRHWHRARLAVDLPANGSRETFLRARSVTGDDGVVVVTPAAAQDSSLLTPFLVANTLVQRPVDDPARAAGDGVWCLEL